MDEPSPDIGDPTPPGGGGGAGGFADIFRQFTQGGSGGPSPGPQQRRRARSRGRDLQHEVMVSFNTAVLGGDVPVGIVDADGTAKTINVKVPAGIEDGKKIRLRGQGERSPMGGEPGDLLIKVKVGAHPFFRRNQLDLEVTVPITLMEATKGGKIDVPTPKGVIALTVPPNTSAGKRLRVRGMGIELADGKKGDLFAELQLTLPEDLDETSIKLLEEIETSQP